jgi:tetraacyldisaccharide 4'-kinase
MNRRWLRPLAPLYAAATAARNSAYDKNLLAARQLPGTVISVGNLSTGGTGKTPFVAELARLLAQAGRKPVVLSRGYGRQSSAIARVTAGGLAAEFGDEPLELAAALPDVPIYVGADRHRAGTLAAQHNPGATFLLDDGFQHRRLARDIDIVLLLPSDLDDTLLPAGNLREPLASLTRAHVLVLREEDMGLAPRFLAGFTRPSCSRPVLWTVRRSLDLAALPAGLGSAVAFAGIARPRDFFSALRAGGVTLPSTLSYPDHHHYSFADVTSIIAALKATSCTTLLTTAKDLARLEPRARAALEACSELHAVPLRAQLLNPAVCLQQIDALCVRQS